MVPYKHYAEPVIRDSVNDKSDQAQICDGPSYSTVMRWKRWITRNISDINGHLKSIGHRELGYSSDLMKSGISLLDELMRSIPNGWLSTILCIIYNSGATIAPVYT